MHERIFVPGTPRLALHYQRPATDATRGNVLYVHGATFPARLAVGFRFDGWSWADDLAAAGFAVWGLDFAGFGDSERYPEMAGSPDAAHPLGRVEAVSQQIERAVRVILERQDVARVSLVAHSWGTLAAGHFAARFPELVERLVLFGPISRRDGVPAGALPAYRDITLEAQWQRFIEDVPPGYEQVLSRRKFAEWGAAYLATDAESETREPASVRVPAGPAADIAAAWSGDFPYDPGQIRSPTLIVRGAWDSLSADADARWLFDALTGAPLVRDVKIGRATHLMHLEAGRFQLYRDVRGFLLGEEISLEGSSVSCLP